jgi:hypothetical protein
LSEQRERDDTRERQTDWHGDLRRGGTLRSERNDARPVGIPTGRAVVRGCERAYAAVRISRSSPEYRGRFDNDTSA